MVEDMSESEILQLSFDENPNADDTRILSDILREHNLSQTNASRSTFAIWLRNCEGQVIGGVLARIAWGLLYIETLAVPVQYRGRGYGSQLLAAAEEEGIARGCRHVHLHTMSFQAPAFYEKHGYTVFEVFEGVPKEYKRYLLKKELG